MPIDDGHSSSAKERDANTLADDSKTIADSPAAGAEHRSPVQVPDHELLTCIGRGSYGEVWLARNVMGTYRAVKIVYRAAFEHARPFEREFNGIQKFEPISRSHDGFVDVLQIGRAPDYFYYVMELADDVVIGQQIDPATYEPKTLRSQVQAHKPLPFEQCVELGLSLTAALSHLHGHGLIHRDIKPSNIIFVNGIAKLADIGLVAEQSEAKSFVGTEGFIPPEGPGTPQADIYSLGKVLYEIATGKDRHEFPALPTMLGDSGTDAQLLELNSVFLKACQSDLKQRYQTAAQMRGDLLLLSTGKSVKRAQALERRITWLTRASVLGVTLTLLTVAGLYVVRKQARREALLRARAEAGEYGADTALAYQALDIGHLGRARELMGKHRQYVEDLSRNGGAGAACWEWRYLWSQVRGDDLFILGRHNPIAQKALYSPDGRHAFSSGKDGLVKYWDLEQRQLVRTLTLPDRTDIGLSRDGHLLAAGVAHGEITVWDVPSFQTSWHATNLDSSAGGLIFSPDGKLLAVGGGSFVTLFSAADGAVQHRLNTGRVRGYSFKVGLGFSPNSEWLAYALDGGQVGLFNTRSGAAETLDKPHDDYAFALAISPDGRYLVTGETPMCIWDFPKRSLVKKLQSHRSNIVCMDFSPDGKLLATGSADQTIKLWDTVTWAEKATLHGHEFELWSVAFSPDGQRLISASKDDTVRVWPVKFTDPAPQLPSISDDADVGSSDEKPVLIRFPSGASEFQAFDLYSARELFRGQRPSGLALTNAPLALFSDFRLGIGRENGQVELWDLRAGRRLWSVQHHINPITALEASARRQELAILHADGTIQLLASRNGALNRTFHSEQAARSGLEVFATHLAFSLDGKRLLAAADRVKQVPVWDIDLGVEHLVPVAHREGITAASLSQDGRLLCTSSYDAYAIVSEVDSGRKLTRCSGQFIGFRGGSFSPDNSRLALVGEEGYLSIWNLQGQRLAMFRAHPGKFDDVSWDTTGNVLATFGTDGLRLWRAPALSEIRTAETAARRGP